MTTQDLQDLEKYLTSDGGHPASLGGEAAHAGSSSRVWLDGQGRAEGRYFNCTLTSVFQPIRQLAGLDLIGVEAFVRSKSVSGDGLSVWKLLELAASDDESIALDRLCRLLHVINFHRHSASQPADLFLNVHPRLLAAVESRHGTAFRATLKAMRLQPDNIVLQLRADTVQQRLLLATVAGNYRRNGFRIAVHAQNPTDAFSLLEGIRPDYLKLDARAITDQAGAARLLVEAGRRGSRLIFKRVENSATFAFIQSIQDSGRIAPYVQGYLLDLPSPLTRFDRPQE